MNEPVAYVNNMCNDSIDWKVDPLKLEEGTPLYTTPQTKPLSDEEEQNFLKWWISSFEHLKACGGGISDDMEIKLQEMKAKVRGEK